MINLGELQDEITTDPAGVGYAPFVASGNHSAIAALLNADDPGAATVDVDTVSVQRMQAQVDATEYLALTAAQRDLWGIIIALTDSVPVSNAKLQSQLTAIWGPGTSTRASLIALLTRTATRAEVLWGSGTKVTAGMVGDALKL